MDTSNSQLWRMTFEFLTRGHTRLELTPKQWKMLITNLIAQLKKNLKYVIPNRTIDHQIPLYGEHFGIKKRTTYILEAQIPSSLFQKGLFLTKVWFEDTNLHITTGGVSVPAGIRACRLFLCTDGKIIQVETSHSVNFPDGAGARDKRWKEKITACNLIPLYLEDILGDFPEVGPAIVKALLNTCKDDLERTEKRQQQKKINCAILERIHACFVT